MNHETADPRAEAARAAIPTQGVALWRCPKCAYDARVQSLGEPCAECGAPLGPEACRPAWLDAESLASRRRLAMSGALCGLCVLVATSLMPLLGLIFAREVVAVIVVSTYVCAGVGLLLQSFVMARLGAWGLSGLRATWMRLAAWTRPIGVVVLVALFLSIDGAERGVDGALLGFIQVAWFVVYLSVPALIIAADIALITRFGRIRKALAIATSPWHVAIFVVQVMLLLLSALIAIVPFIGWFVAPVVWNVLAGLACGVVWWDLSAVSRRGI
jgi:hypothetical protein